MSDATEVKILVALKKEIAAMEKEISRGKYDSIDKFSHVQGQLFGLEKALSIAHNIVAEKEDQI